MCRRLFDADDFIRALYSKKWLANFSLSSLSGKEKIHRIAVSLATARLDEKRNAWMASPREAPNVETLQSGSHMAGDAASHDEETIDGLTEIIVTRAQRLSMVMDDNDDLEDSTDTESVIDADSVKDFSEKASRQGSTSCWVPNAYLLKRSPATLKLGGRLGWQRRWFELSDSDLSWYSSAETAAKKGPPLGRVPLTMVLTAKPTRVPGHFQVDLGNRMLQLALHEVAKSEQETIVGMWINALLKQEVISGIQDESCGHKAKFWKVRKG